MAEALLPTDPNANIIVIRVLRSGRAYRETISDDGQEVDWDAHRADSMVEGSVHRRVHARGR